jgi:hypothetical protein
MMTRRIALLALPITLGLAVPSLAAATDKPAIAVKTKELEARINIENSLKAYPGLYANLHAAGRRQVDKWRAQAAADRKSDPDLFKEGRHYEFERNYTRRSAIGRYISILREDYLDGLGAHPNHETNTILWDAQAKKRISIRPFFKEMVNNGPTLQLLAQAVRAAVQAEKKARDVLADEDDPKMWLEGIKPQLLKLGAVALAPSTAPDKSSGLLFYFSPYAVGPYTEGDYTVFVPWTVFKTVLSAEGTGLFSGERPKGDADNDSI